MVLTCADTVPLILDLGTGLRNFGAKWGWHPFEGAALVSHLHWDHVQGLPFFRPMHRDDSVMHVYGPTIDGLTLDAAVHEFMRPPYFPVGIRDLEGLFVFHDAGPGTFEIGGTTITAAQVPHCGPTLGYRIEAEGFAVAYVSDHQQPVGAPTTVDPAVIELCRAADVLIHDGQYTDAEFLVRPDWGHCTVEYAVEVAAQAGVDQLVLFHHDPGHDDDRLDELTENAAKAGVGRVGSVISAHEGLVLHL